MSSFEQLVRPFAARRVTVTSRIVPATIPATAETAILRWGVAGNIPPGVKQEPGVDLETAGFNMNQCNETWQQVGDPVTERKRITNPNDQNVFVDVDRVTEIQFKANNIAQNPITNAYVASGISEVTAGLSAAIPGTRSCAARYRMSWGD